MFQSLTREQRTAKADRVHFAAADGIRACAIALVFVDHALLLLPRSGSDPVTALALACGGFGLAALFLLSGFLLSGPYLRHVIDGDTFPATANYLRARFLRIYPLYAVAVVGIGAFVALFEPHTAHLRPWDFIAHLLFLHDLTASTAISISPVLWTMAVDVAFYLVLPPVMFAIAFGVRRFKREGRLRATIGALVAVIGASIVYRALAALILQPHNSVEIVVGVRNLAGMAGLFAIGIIAQILLRESASRAWIRRHAAKLLRSSTFAAVAFFGLRLLYLQVGDSALGPLILAIDDLVAAVGAACILLVVSENVNHPLGTWLSSRVMVAAAALSYAFYLVHPTVLALTEQVARRAVPYVLHSANAFVAYALTLALALAILVPLAMLLHVAVERPFLRKKEELQAVVRVPQPIAQVPFSPSPAAVRHIQPRAR